MENENREKQVAAIKSNIDYYKKSVYGQDKNYYHDKDVAEHMRALTGQKTLHPLHIPHLEALGHKVTHIPKN